MKNRFKKLFEKIKKKIKFIKFFKYFFYKNNIKIVFFINFYKLGFLRLFDQTKILKVGFIKNFSKSIYFNFYLKIFNLDTVKEFYINYYLYGVYLNFLNQKFLKLFLNFFLCLNKKSLNYLNK